MNRYTNIYIYIIYDEKSVKKNERDIICGEQSSCLCSSLSYGFDFVDFTVKKKKLFYDSIQRIVSSVLLSRFHLFFLNSMPKPIH